MAGFWAPAGIQDMEYLPAPPEFDDVQPTSSAPSSDYIWVPPCEYWNQDHYVRRAGYWLVANPDWVWVPSHYVWTPRGYVFNAGHWDYPLQDRGVLFAPVYFPQSVYSHSGYRYSPTIVIDLGGLVVNLFTYPSYSHYYFGDYYDDAYLSAGIFPRYQVEQNYTWYDPTFVYDRWHHRDNPSWDQDERHYYDDRHANQDLRPPRTYQQMETRQAARPPDQQQNYVRMAEPLTTVAARTGTQVTFVHIDATAQQKITKQATEVHKYTAARKDWEAKPARQQTAQPPTEQKATVTPPSEHKMPVTTTTDRKGNVTPPANATILR